MKINWNKAEFITSYGLSSQLPQGDEIEIAFVGRSNVGKSSLINKIFNRKALARVSSVPGKTATINFYKADNINFVDLPGYGYAKVSKSDKVRWAKLIEKYFNDTHSLTLVIALVDMRHPATTLDIDMVNYLIECEIPFVVALTKSDKLNKTQTADRLSKIHSELPYGDEITFFPCSAETGAGIDELKALIEDVCEEDEEDFEGEESDQSFNEEDEYEYDDQSDFDDDFDDEDIED